MEFVKFEELVGGGIEDLVLCDEVVCGNKVMCFENDGKIIKEMRKSFNEGRDCMVLDELKDLFGVRKIGIRRVKSDKGVVREDKSNKYWKDNMEYEEGERVYLVMKKFENVGSLSRNKEFWKRKEVRMEYLKILLYRGIFMVSDSNKTNVLVNDRGELMSIDENHIGKRDCILSKRYKFRFEDYEESDYERVLDDLMENSEGKVEEIRRVMEHYEFGDDMINVVINNFEGLKELVYNDIKNNTNGKSKEMRKIGVFNSVSYNGYKCDLMKSCVQKYMRRGEFEKGMYCLWELDLFKGYKYEVNGKEYGGKGIRSNMRNRLLIMLGEDVGCNDWEVWMKVGIWMEKWEKSRDLVNDMDRVYLMNVYKLMCESKKNRMASFIRASFCIGCEIGGIRKKYKEFYDTLGAPCDAHIEVENIRDGDSEELKGHINSFVNMLYVGDDRVFYWFFKIWNYKGKVGSRGRRRKVVFVLLDIMKTFIVKFDNRHFLELYDMIERWVISNNNSRNECWVWVIGLVKFYMNREEIDWDREIGGTILVKNDVEKSIKKNLDGVKIGIDSFCIDMHCGEGRVKGRDGKDFWKEGSVVNNEDGVNELYKSIYGDIKLKNY